MTGKKKNEIWAVILSIVVILEMILSPCQVAYASTPKSSNKKTSQTKAVQEEEAYTVKVTDSKQQPIKGAKISYEIYTDATGESVKENVLNLSVMTDAEGTAKILPISTLQKQDSEVYYRITEISAYGYEVYKDEEVQVVNAENVLTERDFVLSETKVSLTGRVTNQSDNTPLECALVTAGEESTYTNENGDYTILLFFNTEYEMVFSMDGFESATTKFTITGQNSKCNAKLTKSPVYDPNFIFETENPETIIYGTNDNKFSNPAISAVGTEISVKYAITEEKNTDGKDADVAEIDEKTGEVTIKKAGTVKVEATRAGDAEYDETKISYTLTILKANQTGVKFAEQSPKDCYLVDLKNKGYTNVLEGGESSGTVTYKIIEGQDFATIDKVTGKLTFNKAGKVVVEGTKAGDDCYESQSASYSITTLKKNQTDGAFKFEITNPSEFTYNPNENKFVNTASGGEGNGKVTYQIIQGNEVADIDSNSGELTINKAGTVKVQATKIEDEDYESATAVYTLEVSKAQQNNLHFVHAKTEISWNQNGNKYGNELDGGSGTGIVSYKIVSEKNLEEKEVQTGTVATINAESGELAILSTGIIEVQAIKAGDDCYEEAAATYKLTINKATQKIEFAEKNISLYYGKTDYAQSAKEVEIPEAADGKGVGTGSIAYSIDGENPLNAKIDKKTGKVTFVDGKIGTITVKAVKAEDEKYQKCETFYQLQVSYLKTSENLYTLSGEKADAKNDWYIGNIKITAKDGYQISYSNKLKENNWTTSVTYDTEGTTDTNIYLREEATGAITDAVKLSKLKIDKGNPTNLKIEYKKESLIDKFKGFLFGKKEAEVILTAKDDVSGIASFKYQYQSNTISLSSKGQDETEVKFDSSDKNWKKNEDGTVSYTFKIKPQFRGNVSFKAIDNAGNASTQIEDRENTIVVDDTKPEVNISYQAVNGAELKATVEKDTDEKITRNNVDQIDENTRFIYDGTVEATIEVKEANFFKEDVPLVIKRDGKEIWNGAIEKAQEEKDSYSISDWTVDEKNDKATCTIQLKADGDYQVGIAGYQDRAGNEMKYKDGYISNIITVDTTAPELKVTYDNNDVITNADEDYYQADRAATVQVTDRNFRPSEVEFSVISKNVQGKNVTYQYSDLKDWGDWKLVNKNTSTWEAEVPFNVDARYDVSFKYTDLAGHNLEKDFADAFIVDKEAPNLNDMKISYSTHIKTWQKVLHAITFGYYSYKEEVEVTLTAKDDISGIDYLTWTYKQEANTSSVNVKERTETISRKDLTFSEDGKTATGKFKLKATNKEQFRGSISFIATDMAGNDSQVKNDSERVNIVDNISPTRQVLYPQAKQIVDADTLLTKSEYNYGEGTNSILYYDGDVTVTFKVTEANFYAEDVDIRVNNKEQAPTNWQQSGDTWTGSITLSGDGDYVITMTYTDRSTNQMQTYQSEKIVIDTINPVINVSYGNGDVKKTAGERQYFNKVQTATVSITEHNFRADDVAAVVTAKDVNGADVSVTDFARYLSNRGNWTRNGDVYSANITYDADANYTFDIDYKDLALRNAADYKEDQFTVDKTAPSNLKISYSEPVKNQTIGALPYRFYKQLVTVTISAEDNTSGVDHFVYSYRKASGVSSVNAELIDAALANSQVTKNGSKFTSSFTIPRSALGNNNQFNGTVDFVAHDTATNTTDLKDSSRTVVDNISPTASVTYNKPVQEVNGISYYSGKIDVTVQINEANFYAEDVQISVAKDGANGNAMTASWSNNSTDVHTGTFSLSEDGDYIITINYTDRSTNKMETYTSKQLTIDTKHPTIHVSNIKANSANKDETYGFTITATDTADNFTSKEFKPVLEAVTRSENGSYEKKEIPLGDINTNKNNQEYSITVENLEEDGIYTLTCSAKDLANNEYKKFTLDDGEEYESVSFSNNRNGSTFLINKDTENLINQYYVYDVNEDLVISEINTDPVENYTVKLNGKELEEDTEYTTETSSPEDEWSVRKYTIDKDLFDTEGEYNIVVESVDKTETSAYSDVKGLNLSWVVDQTAPIVAVSGLENDGRYKTKEQVVTAIPTDDGGKLKSFKVVVSDKNKKNSSKSGTTLVDLTGDKLEKYLDENDGKVTFKVPEGYQENVRIICTDYAAHKNESETNTYDKVFSKVTVSPSNVVIFYANKPLFYGSIAGVIVVLGGGIIFFIWRRRRENGKQQEE